MCVLSCVHACVCFHVFVRTCPSAFVCAHACAYMCVCVCVRARVCVYTVEPHYYGHFETRGHFLLQYRGFPLSEVKNVLVTPFGTKSFVLITEVFFY